MTENTDPAAVNQKFLAKCLRKSTRTVQTYTDQGMPRNSDGSYSVPDVFDWLLSRSAEGSDGLDPVQELARKNKALADKTELENAQTRGEVGLISEVADRLGGHIDRACARLEQIPDALGQFCDARTAAIIVPECKRLIREARAELAVDMASLGGPAGGKVGAGAGPDREPVGGREPPPVERKQRGARPVAN